MSASSLDCVAPSSKIPGSVCVEVSNNNADFSSNCVQFEYTPAAAVTGLSPKHGPRTGATEVTVTGTNFRADSGEMRCRFGGVDATEVRAVSNNTVVCVAPALPSGSAVGWVPVEVSNNGGVDFTQSGLQYLFVEAARVDYVYPESGPESGGTLLMVGGANFYSAPDLRCHFFAAGSNTTFALGPGSSTSATWISSSAITCPSPVNRPETVRVAVSSNGQQTSTDSQPRS